MTWVHRCWPQATPDVGSVSVISSFLLQDIPRHDTRLVEVREAFERTLLRGFRAYCYVSAYHIGTSREVNEARAAHTCSRPCAFEKKKNQTSPSHPKHHAIYSRPATATTPRRLATGHVPRVSPCSPALIDSGIVEVGRVQLS